MASISPTLADRLGRPERSSSSGFTTSSNTVLSAEATASGVSWAAVIAGAAVAAALSLALLALGAGLGLSVVSPWTGDGASASAIGTASIVYLIAMQLVAAAMGGYLAGRLRTKWSGVHDDEVYFRDTAHGFLVWAVGLVLTASLLTTAASSIIGGVAKAGAAGATVAAASVGVAGAASATKNSGASEDSGPSAYLVDSLFRSNTQGSMSQAGVPSVIGGPATSTNAVTGSSGAANDATTAATNAATKIEAARIITNGVVDMSAADKTYLAQLIAAKTGIASVDAEKRITELQTRIRAKEIAAREAADVARKAAAKVALWIFLGLLIGAFCASFAATIGGRQRDKVVA